MCIDCRNWDVCYCQAIQWIWMWKQRNLVSKRRKKKYGLKFNSKSVLLNETRQVRHSIKSPWDALGAPSLETASQSGADSGSKSQAVISQKKKKTLSQMSKFQRDSQSASGSSISSLFGTSSLPQARRAASHTVKMGAPHYAGGVSNNRRQSSGHSKAQPAPLFVGRADASSSTEVSDEAAPPVDVEEDRSV